MSDIMVLQLIHGSILSILSIKLWALTRHVKELSGRLR